MDILTLRARVSIRVNRKESTLFYLFGRGENELSFRI